MMKCYVLISPTWLVFGAIGAINAVNAQLKECFCTYLFCLIVVAIGISMSFKKTES